MEVNSENLKKYMLLNEKLVTNINNDSNIINEIPIKNLDKKNEKKNEKKKEISNLLFEDELFSYFIKILDIKFDFILENRFKFEKDFKIEAISKFREIKSKLKAMKLKLNCIENDLLNEKKISIKTLIALCLLYNKNLMYICKNKYYEIVNNSESVMNVIIKEDNNYKLLENDENINFDYYRENYYRIENIEKPLKAISGYTKDELKLIYEKLQIKDIDIRSNKKEVYQRISENINFFF